MAGDLGYIGVLYGSTKYYFLVLSNYADGSPLSKHKRPAAEAERSTEKG